MDPSLPLISSANLAFAEAQWARYLDDPVSVDATWRRYFGRLNSPGPSRQALGVPSFPHRTLFNPPGGSPSGGETQALAPLALPPVSAAQLARNLSLLRGLRIFTGVPDEELVGVAHFATERQLAKGEMLFREAEEGNELFVLAAGHLVVQRKGTVVATINPGEVVGELAVLDAQPRAADVIAHSDVRVLRVGGQDLEQLLARRPVLARSVIHMLTSRLRLRSDRQDRVNKLIHAYRVRGHLRAHLDPLGSTRTQTPELDPAYYGLDARHMGLLFASTTTGGMTLLTLREILTLLESTYCSSIGVQFMHIDDIQAKDWLIERMEDSKHHRQLERDEKLRIFTKLADAESFEQFIHHNFVGAKRFSLEGAETLIPLLDLAIEEAGAQAIEEAVIGMAHRGRLNVLVNIIGKSPSQVFREFTDDAPEAYRGRGDVKYHLGFGSERETASGQSVHLSLCFNPSHLEFVNPVTAGRVRAKQDRFDDRQRRRCMGVLIHGDAAFAGQGVNQELFNMSRLPGFSTGGILHIIVNNQIGFTTPAAEGRSTQYASDLARMLQTPIFHVNGEDPNAVAQVVRLAMAYRETFRQDVIIDMYCYRRYGHNEGDEPSYTQPLLYAKIRKRRSVRDGYLASLADEGIDEADARTIEDRQRKRLEAELNAARSAEKPAPHPAAGAGFWRPYRGGPDADTPEVPTGMPAEDLSAMLTRLTETPADFHLHPKLGRALRLRQAMAAGERPLDWAAGEALAYASLVAEGYPVRISGQDAQRGTFSHRHAALHDVKDGHCYIPLAHLRGDQARFEIYNSPLSEVAVVGFEYGYSLDTPEGLTVWEAQFGDFSNVAQVIFDQFISSSEEKWRRLSGLVMLLPHGFEGQGPEHSSARLERFLTLAAEDNLQVVNLTSPAQLFHCLRRQVLRPWRKPLVVMSPKSLLRHPLAVSPLDELATGRFHRILPDTGDSPPASVRKIILTSGKVYYELAAAREKRSAHDVAILRLEQYYPLSQDVLAECLAPYPAGTPLVWTQEEPHNMGAWSFIARKLRAEIADRWPLSCVSRAESASPATGSSAAHKLEQAELIDRALA